VISAEVDAASLRNVEGAMDRVEFEAKRAVERAIVIVAELVLEIARQRVAVDTGALKASLGIEYNSDKTGAKIGPQDPDTWYAVFVEWGSLNVPPQPFQTPAGEAARAEFMPTVLHEVRRGLGTATR
jgi:HK97 gp10 family phage protein